METSVSQRLNIFYIMFKIIKFFISQTTQLPKEKVQRDKQRWRKITYKTKDRVTRTPIKTGDELMFSEGYKFPLRKFYGCHHDLVDRYGISLSQMTTDMFHLSLTLPGSFLVHELPKEKVQRDKQRWRQITYKAKDRVTRTPIKTGDELMFSEGYKFLCH
jgi:hypothetical protein